MWELPIHKSDFIMQSKGAIAVWMTHAKGDKTKE